MAMGAFVVSVVIACAMVAVNGVAIPCPAGGFPAGSVFLGQPLTTTSCPLFGFVDYGGTFGAVVPGLQSGGNAFQVTTSNFVLTNLGTYTLVGPAPITLTVYSAPTFNFTTNNPFSNTLPAGTYTAVPGASCTLNTGFGTPTNGNIPSSTYQVFTCPTFGNAGSLASPGITLAPGYYFVACTGCAYQEAVSSGAPGLVQVSYGSMKTTAPDATWFSLAGSAPVFPITNMVVDGTGTQEVVVVGSATTIQFSLPAMPKTGTTVTVTFSLVGATGTINPTSLTFTPTNWNQPQPVTITLTSVTTHATKMGTQAAPQLVATYTGTDPYYAGESGTYTIIITNGNPVTTATVGAPVYGVFANSVETIVYYNTTDSLGGNPNVIVTSTADAFHESTAAGIVYAALGATFGVVLVVAILMFLVFGRRKTVV